VNTDKTDLFYNLTLNNTLEFRGRRCTGSKNSWERITLLLHTDLTGTNKLHPLIIGQYRCPRCFKNVHNLPCEHHGNVKASMTGNISKMWILSSGSWMRAKKCKILLWQLIGEQYARKNVSTVFFHIISWKKRFLQESYWTKNVFWFSLQFFSETFLILRRTDKDMIKNVFWSSYKVTIILVRF
jgi:hypothetical protein